jgi:hypothetical protein
MNTSLHFPPYQSYISVDLRAFDVRQHDYGVGEYVERLGFLPHVLLYHETNADQIHLHAMPLDDTPLDYMWVTQRGMPGGQLWTRRQLRGLVDALHAYGIKFYQGMEAAWSYWRRHNTKAKWPYQHPEVFITYADGRSTANDTGAINVLARLQDGTWYEDLLCRDLVRYLRDYDMDGFFAADGMAGLKVRLQRGDYSDGMIQQFEEFAGLHVLGDATADKARWIWSEHKAAWIQFYIQRWASFYAKLSAALTDAGKELASMDPWARGPADSVYDFGFDYRTVSQAGHQVLALQAHEENWGRRWRQGWYVWEPGQVVAAATIKAHAPETSLLWSLGSANSPENWYAIQDTPAIFERQLLSLPVITCVDSTGVYERAFSGYQNVFGIDLSRDEWQWLRDRLDFSFGAAIDRTLGLTIVWSENVHWEHIRRGRRWEITTPLIRLNLAGVPIHSATNMDSLPAARSEAYVIVDPLGISDSEVEALICKRQEGAAIVVIGEVQHARLLEELGLSAIAPQDCTAWTTTTTWPADLGKAAQGTEKTPVSVTCQATSALSLIEPQDGRGVLASIKRYAKGTALYLAKTQVWPTFTPGVPEPADAIRPPGFDNMKALAASLPAALERQMAGIIHWGCNLQVRTSDGQVHAFTAGDGSVSVMIENIANLFYVRLDLRTRFAVADVTHFPIKWPSPTGYLVTRSLNEHGCQVTVPPDGCIPLRITPMDITPEDIALKQ